MANLKFLMLQSLNFVPEVWEKLQAYVKKKKKNECGHVPMKLYKNQAT